MFKESEIPTKANCKMVEATGIEPVSTSKRQSASTCVFVTYTTSKAASRQATKARINKVVYRPFSTQLKSPWTILVKLRLNQHPKQRRPRRLSAAN